MTENDAARREVFHQREKERHVVHGDALFIERQDVVVRAGVDQKIGILDALGDALVGLQFAKIVAREKRRERFGRNIGVDGHDATQALRRAVPSRGLGPCTRKSRRAHMVR